MIENNGQYHGVFGIMEKCLSLSKIQFNGYRVSDLGEWKSSGELSHNNVNTLNTAELYT